MTTPRTTRCHGPGCEGGTIREPSGPQDAAQLAGADFASGEWYDRTCLVCEGAGTVEDERRDEDNGRERNAIDEMVACFRKREADLRAVCKQRDDLYEENVRLRALLDTERDIRRSA